MGVMVKYINQLDVCVCAVQEFENTGEEYQADLSTLASSGSQDGPEVYVLPLTEVSLPVAKQPCRSSKNIL